MRHKSIQWRVVRIGLTAPCRCLDAIENVVLVEIGDDRKIDGKRFIFTISGSRIIGVGIDDLHLGSGR